MNECRKFIVASSHYLITQLALLAASLISFPIIIRLLSIEEYGILTLCNTILLFGVALSKLGLQNSIIRFFPYYKELGQLPCFFRTYSFTGLIFGIFFFCVLEFFLSCYLPSYSPFLPFLVAAMVLVQSLFSYLSTFLRCQEQSIRFCFISIAGRYLSTFGSIALILWLNNGVVGIFQSQILSYGLMAILLAFSFWRELLGVGKTFSKALFCESLRFGLPMVVSEASTILLAFSDRFLITHFNGSKSLGIYAVAYSLCMYLADLIRQPLDMAVAPMYTRIYTQEGELQAKQFLSSVAKYIALIAFPIFAGCVAIKEELIIFLATTKYSEAVQILPWVLGGLLLNSCSSLVVAGLYLKKQTALVAKISLLSGILNILVNIILLPRYGIISAAWTTAGCYFLVFTVTSFFAYREFPLAWPWFTIIRFAACSYLMFLAVRELPAGSNLFLKIFIGIISYFGAVFILHFTLHNQIFSFFKVRQ